MWLMQHTNAPESNLFDRMVKLLDEHQMEMEKLRKPERAERIREIAHALALYRIEFYGQP